MANDIVGRESARHRVVPRLEAAIKKLLRDHIHDVDYKEVFATLRDAIDAIKDLERYYLNH